MTQRVDSSFVSKLEPFGKVGDWQECFHCGNCTAICPLTEQGFLFPRQGIRQLQMGLRNSLGGSLEPWLCYYCGDCSEQCPRDANPGELQMVLRRYLTSIYDWTGLSRKFYTSKTWEFGFIALFALIVIVLFGVFSPPSAVDTSLTAQGGVKINQFAPVKWIEYGDWSMAAIVSCFLLSNIFNMFCKTILSDKKLKIPLSAYIMGVKDLGIHFATQMKFSKCNGKYYWLAHFLLMSGYTVMFTMIVVFLPLFQIETIEPITHWTRFLGYYASFGLLFGLIIMFAGRFSRKDEKFKFSHFSDWLFVIMLFLTTVTGLMVHFFRIYGMPMATYYSYVIHLAILVPMIMIEVPFSKWSHLAYRPFAIYFAGLKKAAMKGC